MVAVACAWDGCCAPALVTAAPQLPFPATGATAGVAPWRCDACSPVVVVPAAVSCWHVPPAAEVLLPLVGRLTLVPTLPVLALVRNATLVAAIEQACGVGVGWRRQPGGCWSGCTRGRKEGRTRHSGAASHTVHTTGRRAAEAAPPLFVDVQADAVAGPTLRAQHTRSDVAVAVWRCRRCRFTRGQDRGCGLCCFHSRLRPGGELPATRVRGRFDPRPRAVVAVGQDYGCARRRRMTSKRTGALGGGRTAGEGNKSAVRVKHGRASAQTTRRNSDGEGKDSAFGLLTASLDGWGAATLPLLLPHRGHTTGHGVRAVTRTNLRLGRWRPPPAEPSPVCKQGLQRQQTNTTEPVQVL